MTPMTKGIRAISIVLGLFFSCECFAQDPVPDSDSPRKNYLIPALEIVGFDFALNRFNNRLIDRESFDVSAASIRRNLKARWVVDNDEFSTNQFLHPYQGAIYHSAARSAGLSYWESTAYTFAGSALWEIAGEVTPPSKNDQ